MNKDFQNFMISRNLGENTQRQYTLYFEKIEVLYENKILNQNTINDFIATYKSNLVRSFLRMYLEYRNIQGIKINKRTGRVSRKKPLIMSKEDVEKILEVLYAYNEKIALMVELSYCCALRREEVCNINVGDINWEEWKKERNTGTLLISKAKGDKQRYVIIPKELMIKLKDYVNKISVKRNDKLFFKSDKDKQIPISKERYWEIFHEVVVGLFGKKYKLHTLRHTKSTQWYSNGVDIVSIQERLGHSNIATTRLYINPENERELEKWRKE